MYAIAGDADATDNPSASVSVAKPAAIFLRNILPPFCFGWRHIHYRSSAIVKYRFFIYEILIHCVYLK